MNAERLLKLAAFLDVLPENKFDFANIVLGRDVPNDTLSCGSVACGIGWAPVVFPDVCKYKKMDYGDDGMSIRVRIIDDPEEAIICYDQVGAHLFDIPQHHAEALFSPYDNARRIHPSLIELDEFSKPAELAANLRAYVAAFSTSNS